MVSKIGEKFPRSLSYEDDDEERPKKKKLKFKKAIDKKIEIEHETAMNIE